MLLNATLSSSNTGLEEHWSPPKPLAKNPAYRSRACGSACAKKKKIASQP